MYRYKKCYESHYETCSSERKHVEEPVGLATELRVNIDDSSDIEEEFNRCCYVKNPAMDIIENNHCYEIAKRKKDHVLGIYVEPLNYRNLEDLGKRI